MDPNKMEVIETVVNLNPDDIEVVVEDDTPEADRNRKPLEKDPLAEKSTLEEAEEVSGKVKKRIGELTRKAHDERREKEAAIREREEATRIASAALQRNRLLESQLNNGEVAFANETAERAKLSVESAKAKYRKAFEAGDPEAIADASAELAAATNSEQQARNWMANAQRKLDESAKKPLHKESDGIDSDTSRVDTQPNTQRPAVSAPDESATDWASRNEWFGKNRKMTSYVYGVHEDLVFEQGINPVEDAEEYYKAIDSEMRQRFPEYEWGDEGATSKPAAVPPPTTRKSSPAPIVAPVTRAPTGAAPGKVTLTKSEVALAKKIGLTVEEYAREKIKLGA